MYSGHNTEPSSQYDVNVDKSHIDNQHIGDKHTVIQGNTIHFNIITSEGLEAFKKIIGNTGLEITALKDNKITLEESEEKLRGLNNLSSLASEAEKETGTKIEKLEAGGLEISHNEVLWKQMILAGNHEAYSGNYSIAEHYYKKAIDLDKNNVAALINLSFIYSEYLYKYKESLEISRRLVEVQPGLESKSNFVEDLIQAGRYQEAREYASQVVNTPEGSDIVYERNPPLLNTHTLDYSGYQIVNRFFILCSYLLERDLENSDRALAEFVRYYRQLKEDFKIEKEQWVFSGLINAIYNSSPTQQAKFLLYSLIDLLQGNIARRDLSAMLYL